VVTPVGEELSLGNLDRWYERDAGERIGKFMFYRVKLRDEELNEAVQSTNPNREALTGTEPDILNRRSRHLALDPKPAF
jgi:hypothetical protein